MWENPGILSRENPSFHIKERSNTLPRPEKHPRFGVTLDRVGLSAKCDTAGATGVAKRPRDDHVVFVAGRCRHQSIPGKRNETPFGGRKLTLVTVRSVTER